MKYVKLRKRTREPGYLCVSSTCPFWPKQGDVIEARSDDQARRALSGDVTVEIIAPAKGGG